MDEGSALMAGDGIARGPTAGSGSDLQYVSQDRLPPGLVREASAGVYTPADPHEIAVLDSHPELRDRQSGVAPRSHVTNIDTQRVDVITTGHISSVTVQLRVIRRFRNSPAIPLTV